MNRLTPSLRALRVASPTGCASRVDLPSADSPMPRLRLRHSAIAPGNHGELIGAPALQPRDILLTSIATLNSLLPPMAAGEF